LLGPNGLVFTPDEQRLLVSDSRARHVKSFPVHGDGSLGPGEVLVECPDGTVIGRVRVPEITANITFGGPRRNRMFIAANTTLYSLVMSVTGPGPTGS